MKSLRTSPAIGLSLLRAYPGATGLPSAPRPRQPRPASSPASAATIILRAQLAHSQKPRPSEISWGRQTVHGQSCRTRTSKPPFETASPPGLPPALPLEPASRLRFQRGFSSVKSKKIKQILRGRAKPESQEVTARQYGARSARLHCQRESPGG